MGPAAGLASSVDAGMSRTNDSFDNIRGTLKAENKQVSDQLHSLKRLTSLIKRILHVNLRFPNSIAL